MLRDSLIHPTFHHSLNLHFNLYITTNVLSVVPIFCLFLAILTSLPKAVEDITPQQQ